MEPGNAPFRKALHHGYFQELVPNQRIVDMIEFETEDPSMQGEMTTTITLSDAGDGTEVLAVRGSERAPPTTPPNPNTATSHRPFPSPPASLPVRPRAGPAPRAARS